MLAWLTAMSVNELLLNASVTRTFSMRMLSLPASLLGLRKINSVTCYRHRSLASLVTQAERLWQGKPPVMQGTDAIYIYICSCLSHLAHNLKPERDNDRGLTWACTALSLASKVRQRNAMPAQEHDPKGHVVCSGVELLCYLLGGYRPKWCCTHHGMTCMSWCWHTQIPKPALSDHSFHAALDICVCQA